MTSPLADVLVVLGARVHPDGSLSAALQRRVERGARAWKDGLAPLILCTGGKRWNGHSEAHRMRDELVRQGVDDSAVLLDLFSQNTAENAFYSARIMRLQGLGSAVVVSCPWHLPRALRDFSRCGVDARPLPAEPGSATVRQWLWRQATERFSSTVDAVHLGIRTRIS